MLYVQASNFSLIITDMNYAVVPSQYNKKTLWINLWIYMQSEVTTWSKYYQVETEKGE